MRRIIQKQTAVGVAVKKHLSDEYLDSQTTRNSEKGTDGNIYIRKHILSINLLAPIHTIAFTKE